MLFRFILSLSIVFIASAEAWACSCIEIDNKTVSEHIHSNVVFVGRPINSQLVDPARPYFGDVITTFEVDKLLKGEIAETVEIRHSQDDGSCGVQFELGETQLLMAYDCLLYTSPSPRDQRGSRMPSSA